MRRVSSKHSPRQDDELKHKEHALLHGNIDEGRTEPRRDEASGEDEPGVGHRTVEDETVDRLSEEQLERRVALSRCFSPSVFPARRDTLVEEAIALFADEGTLAKLRKLPDQMYHSLSEVFEATEAQSDHPDTG